MTASRKRARRRAFRLVTAITALWGASCGGAGGAAPNSTSPPTSLLAAEAPPGEMPSRPTGPMGLEEARRYVCALINRDRAAAGLPPVRLDDAATRAGQGHAEDMAAHGFTAHIGSDGSVPEQRYTEAGGRQMVMENVGCFADGTARPLADNPVFPAEGLERIEHAFMDERPPNDGHRRNILTPWHTSVGIGLAQTVGIDVPCMAEELVDDLGDYGDLPRRAKVGTLLAVHGRVREPARVAGVGLSRIDTPRPRSAAELNRTHSYAIPKPYATYFPRGFKSPIPLEIRGDTFRIEVPLSDDGRRGLYGVSVWANLPGKPGLQMISLRTLTVD